MFSHEYKSKKLHSLEKEVSDFHPVLRDLFPKLPNVKNIEYHQGPSEFGADFVLSILDSTLDVEEYVGVIVKCGNIKQNHDEIERQIKECQMPRKLEGGKKNITLNQIWIVTNGSISSNAKNKISHEYSSQNIKFIWDEKLIKLFDKHYPEFWEDLDSNVGHYLSALERRVKSLNDKHSILDEGQNELYIDQEIVRYELKDKKRFRMPRKQKKEKLSAVLEYERFVWVEAEMGYGKSKLLRQESIAYAQHNNFIEKRVLPIFINYRDLQEQYDNSLTKIIERLVNVDKLYLDDVTLLFVVDAVDELKGEEHLKAQAVSDFVGQLIEHNNMRVVFASRPFSDHTAEAILDKSVSRFQLVSLSMERIVKFVESLCSKNVITSKLKSDLHKSDLFRSLPRSPISAILLGRVLNSDIKELPSSLPELYSKYLELVLGRWDLKKGKVSEKEYETTIILIRLIAKFMLETNLSEIGIGDAKQIVRDYLAERETGLSPEKVSENILSCNQVICVDEVQNKLFFRHRSFLEFMYGEHLFFTYGKAAMLENPFDPYWGAANYFYFGRLKDCPEQLKTTFSQIPMGDAAKISKIYQSGSYLLAAYQSPYSTVIECLRNVILDAADLYCSVCDAPEKSSFGIFPEVQLLAIITSIVKHSFEYDFFSKAFQDIETDLLLNSNFDKHTAVSAFFVASVRAGLGNKDAFKLLIEDHESELPLSIKYGVKHVAESADLLNDTIKRLEKKMMRKTKADPKSAELLYEKPLIEIKKSQKLVNTEQNDT